MLARPITPLRALLFGALTLAFVGILAIAGLRDFFALDLPEAAALVGVAGTAGAAILLLELGWQISQWRHPSEDRTPRVALHNPAATTSRDA